MRIILLVFIYLVNNSILANDSLNIVAFVINKTINIKNENDNSKINLDATYKLEIIATPKRKETIYTCTIFDLIIFNERLTKNHILSSIENIEVEIKIDQNKKEIRIKKLGRIINENLSFNVSDKCRSSLLFCPPCYDYVESVLKEEFYFLLPIVLKDLKDWEINNYNYNLHLPLTYNFENKELTKNTTTFHLKADRKEIIKYYSDIRDEFLYSVEERKDRDYDDAEQDWLDFKARQEETGKYYSNTHEEFVEHMFQEKQKTYKGIVEFQDNYLMDKVENMEEKELIFEFLDMKDGFPSLINLFLDKAEHTTGIGWETDDTRFIKTLEIIDLRKQ